MRLSSEVDYFKSAIWLNYLVCMSVKLANEEYYSRFGVIATRGTHKCWVCIDYYFRFAVVASRDSVGYQFPLTMSQSEWCCRAFLFVILFLLLAKAFHVSDYARLLPTLPTFRRPLFSWFWNSLSRSRCSFSSSNQRDLIRALTIGLFRSYGAWDHCTSSD